MNPVPAAAVRNTKSVVVRTKTINETLYKALCKTLPKQTTKQAANTANAESVLPQGQGVTALGEFQMFQETHSQ